MSDVHVAPHRHGWSVRRAGRRNTRVYNSLTEALTAASKVAAVVNVFGRDGRIVWRVKGARS